jgi:hypothetical protein
MEETLQQSKSRLQSEQARIVEEIESVRREGRDYGLRAQSTHEVQDPKEGERRCQRIATLQASLLEVQSQLGETNRAIRSQKPSQIVNGQERARRELEERHFDPSSTVSGILF